LPLEIRQLARKHYAKQENIVALGEVIDEYRLLLFPDGTERAKELIARFAELLQGDNLADPNGHEERPFHGHESSDSRPAPKREQERDQKNAEKQEKELDKEDTQSSSADSDSDDSDSDDDSQSNSSANDSADDSDSDSDSNGNGAGDSDDEDDSDSDSKEDSDSSSDFGDVTVDEDSDDDSESDDSYEADNLSRHAGAGGKSKTGNSKEVTDTMEEIIQSVTEDLMDNLNKLIVLGETGLIDEKNLKIYFRYWFDILSGVKKNKPKEFITKLHNYLDFYGYDGILTFLNVTI
jgi:hypothetical protein